MRDEQPTHRGEAIMSNEPRFEAARDQESAQLFATLEAALDHIDGSRRHSTRPWVRATAAAAVSGSFLIISGRLQSSPYANGTAHLNENERAELAAWRFIAPEVRILLEVIDSCTDGYARLDRLDKRAREGLFEALTMDLVELSVPSGDMVHRRGAGGKSLPAADNCEPSGACREGSFRERQT